MANKKNLPNIPIYIGDWERDCNVLSLETEAAWMRIIFKMWSAGKQNTIKMPAKSLQNLWRCSPEKAREILDDLIFNNIAEIAENSGFIEFTCRRFVKENALSKIRSEAGKTPSKKKKEKSKPNQTESKSEQNHDIDNENESEYVIEKNKKEKKNKILEDVKLTPSEYQKLVSKYGQVQTEWMLDKLNNYKISKGKKYKSDYAAILNWVVASYNEEKQKNNGNEPTINRQTASTIQSNASGW